MSVHEQYMRRCISLAGNGLGHTLSNPLVGCVIVRDGKIIGEGYHHEFGGPHAEIVALENAGNPTSLKDCTIYINLEPCTHQGKTPPCVNKLIELQPARVVIAHADPNPLVAEQGIGKLKNSGIEVITGMLEKEARFINRRFITFHEKKRPYIILKWAQTSDGFVAPEKQEPGKRLIISNEFMHTLVHTWRAQEMAICAGMGTVLHDNPELTVRLVEGKNPVRVILDRELEIPRSRKVFNTQAQTLVYNCIKDETADNVELIQASRDKFAADILKNLWNRNIVSLFVEGGPNLFNSLLHANAWDEMRVITAPSELKNGIIAPPKRGKLFSSNEINGDTLEIFMNVV